MDVDINTFRERKPVVFTAGGCGRLPFATKTGAKTFGFLKKTFQTYVELARPLPSLQLMWRSSCKLIVGRLLSFWEGLLSVAMLSVSGKVVHHGLRGESGEWSSINIYIKENEVMRGMDDHRHIKNISSKNGKFHVSSKKSRAKELVWMGCIGWWTKCLRKWLVGA